jgi:hypothetical protein
MIDRGVPVIRNVRLSHVELRLAAPLVWLRCCGQIDRRCRNWTANPDVPESTGPPYRPAAQRLSSTPEYPCYPSDAMPRLPPRG